MTKVKQKKRTIFFESYSLLNIILMIFPIIRSDEIYFHYKPFPKLPVNKRLKTIVVKIIRALNKNVIVSSIDHDVMLKENWICNDKAVRILKKNEVKLCDSLPVKFIQSYINDSNVVKCFQNLLVNRISSKLLFQEMCGILCKNLKRTEIFCIIPSGDMNIFREEFYTFLEMYSLFIPTKIHFINKIKRFFFAIIICTGLVIAPIIYLLRKIGKVGRIKERVCADIAMPVIYGIDNFKKYPTFCWSDDFLYNESIIPGNIVHIWDFWKLRDEKTQETKGIMQKKGMKYTSRINWKVNYVIIGRLIKDQLKFLLIVKHFVKYLYIDTELLFGTLIVYHQIIDQLVEFENVDYKVYFRRDDYAIRHIINTIMCNKVGRQVVGTNHVASSFDVPPTAFIYFHNYIIYGKIYEELMSKFWKGQALQKTGREFLDPLAFIMKNPKIRLDINRNFEKSSCKRKNSILIIFPGASSDITLISRWDEMFKGLSMLSKTPIDVNIILRFRFPSLKVPVDTMKVLDQFYTLAENDDRFIIESHKFSTSELMAISDLIIAHSASFAVNEALVTDAKVFTFDFMGTAPYYFDKYGDDFILTTSEDLNRVIQAVGTDYLGFDVKWDELKKDANYYTDGNNLDRIRDVLLKSVNEIKSLN